MCRKLYIYTHTFVFAYSYIKRKPGRTPATSNGSLLWWGGKIRGENYIGEDIDCRHRFFTAYLFF